MRSSELAELAGVSVRTLRHYHQIGILEEPDRSANGYRDYDVHDLVQVLRIKRLAGLGIALEAVPAVLGDTGAGHDAVLEQLDAELAAQVAALEEQRAVIARLRRDGAAPDLPPELARHWHALVGAGQSSRLAALDRDLILLLADVGGGAAVPLLTRLYAHLDDPALRASYVDLLARFDRVTTATEPEEVDRLVEESVAFMGPLVAAAGEDVDLGPLADLVDMHTHEALDPARRVVLDRIGAGLS